MTNPKSKRTAREYGRASAAAEVGNSAVAPAVVPTTMGQQAGRMSRTRPPVTKGPPAPGARARTAVTDAPTIAAVGVVAAPRTAKDALAASSSEVRGRGAGDSGVSAASAAGAGGARQAASAAAGGAIKRLRSPSGRPVAKRKRMFVDGTSMEEQYDGLTFDSSYFVPVHFPKAQTNRVTTIELEQLKRWERKQHVGKLPRGNLLEGDNERLRVLFDWLTEEKEQVHKAASRSFKKDSGVYEVDEESTHVARREARPKSDVVSPQQLEDLYKSIRAKVKTDVDFVVLCDLFKTRATFDLKRGYYSAIGVDHYLKHEKRPDHARKPGARPKAAGRGKKAAKE